MWKALKTNKGELNLFIDNDNGVINITYPKENILSSSHIKAMIKKGYKITKKTYVLNSLIITFKK